MTTLSDSVSTLITANDGTCLCQIVDSRFISIITSRATEGACWQSIAIKDSSDCFVAKNVKSDPPELYRLFKIWIPFQYSTKRYITNAVFRIHISEAAKRERSLVSGYVWLNQQDIEKHAKAKTIISTIFLLFHPKAVLGKNTFNWEAFNDQFHRYSILIEVRDSVLFLNTKTPIEIFADLSELKSFQTVIYTEFLTTCFPNVLMSSYHFTKFTTKVGLSKDEVSQLFRAADAHGIGFLSFREFMCSLMVIDPSTSHVNISADIRNRFIFRLFAKNDENEMTAEEIENLLKYIKTYKKDFDVRAALSIIGVSGTKKLSLLEFLKLANNLKIEGLPEVLRVNKPLKVYFKTRMMQSSIFKSEIVQTYGNNLKSSGANFTSSPPTENVDNMPWQISIHSMLVSDHGTTLTLESLFNVHGVCSPSTLINADITKVTRKNSLDRFSITNLYNDLLDSLNTLCNSNKIKIGNSGNIPFDYGWSHINASVFARKLIQVTKNAKDILSKEPRLLQIRGPVYIFGEFFGNFGDLTTFENYLWPMGIGFCAANVLVLGNYSNRGPFGMEVITYLLCNKCLFPQRVFLIRGGYDHRNLQHLDNFLDECITKFGTAVGKQVWSAIHEVFDCMPLSATVDENLFCCSGGIPQPIICTIASNINKIPVPLQEPDKDSLAWALLWNQPAKLDDISPEVEEEMNNHEGFAKNTKRGTGYLFGNNALQKFLLLNNYSHFLRTNESPMCGFTISNNCRIITIVSSSNYANRKNDSACVLAEKRRLSVIRLGP